MANNDDDKSKFAEIQELREVAGDDGALARIARQHLDEFALYAERKDHLLAKKFRNDQKTVASDLQRFKAAINKAKSGRHSDPEINVNAILEVIIALSGSTRGYVTSGMNRPSGNEGAHYLYLGTTNPGHGNTALNEDHSTNILRILKSLGINGATLVRRTQNNLRLDDYMESSRHDSLGSRPTYHDYYIEVPKEATERLAALGSPQQAVRDEELRKIKTETLLIMDSELRKMVDGASKFARAVNKSKEGKPIVKQ